MKRGFQVWLACIFICVASNGVLATLNSNWRLIFSDEFNGTTLDTSKWTARNTNGNYGNGELQWYTSDAVSVKNGNMVIKSSKNATGINGFYYTSGWVDSKDKFFNTYGRWETRTWFPGGQGYWPANWMLSQVLCWPLGAEFDIAEYRGATADNYLMGSFYHGGPACAQESSGPGAYYSNPNKASLATGYHVFAMEWWPTNATIYLDDQVVLSFQGSDLANAFDVTPHYYVFNTAVGGGYPGDPDSTTPFPNYQYVDYIRVYSWKTSCSMANVCSNHGCCYSANVTCKCDPGWYGSSCEYWWGSYVSTFPSTDTMMDSPVNGWGNGYSLYLQNNLKISNGLALHLTSSGCPKGCGGLSMSGSGWSTFRQYDYGTFSFYLKSTRLSGTGVTLALQNSQGLLQQIAFIFSGATPTKVQLGTWAYSQYFPQSTVDLGFDASQYYHNYSIVYMPTYVTFLVDGKAIYNTTYGVPVGEMSFGIYYGSNPSTFGAMTTQSKMNSTVYVTKVTWLVYTSPASCVAPPAPTQPPALDPCTGTYSNAFLTSDSTDSVQNGWGNAYTIYLTPNAVINRGLNLTLTNANCPSHCGNLPYSGGAWQSSRTFSYGTFSYIAKSTSVSGTGLVLAAADSTGSLDQIAVVLSGDTPNVATVSSWLNGWENPESAFQLPFDASAGYHNYSFLYTSTSITYYVDGNAYYVQTTNIPTPPLSFGAYYSAEPDWYGALSYAGPYYASVSQVSYIIYPASTCNNAVKPVTCAQVSTSNTATLTTGTSSCGETYLNNFNWNDNNTDVIVNGWGNGYSFYYYPNTQINCGLTLSLSNVNCPTDCANYVVTGAGWTSVSTFSYGSYTFLAKSTKISGTALSLLVSSTDGSEQISFTLSGQTPNSASVTTFHSGYQYPAITFTLPFDASAAYHNYTFSYAASGVTWYVDNVSYASLATNVPVGQLSFGAYYSAQPSWYGAFSYTGLSYAYVSQVNYKSC